MAGQEVQRETYEDLCNSRSTPLVYRRLDQQRKEIRLLRILNRFTFEDFLFTPEGLRKSEEDANFRLDNERTFVIECDIAHFPLDACPPYMALSYTWGHDSVKRPVFFPKVPSDPQCEQFHRLEVTENLFQALRQLKPMKDIAYIWADAICINQNDDHEKSWQVAQMWRIYESSRYVMIWLGSGGTATNELMDGMHETIGTLVNSAEDPGGLKLEDCRVPETFRMMSDFQHFTEQPYWTRAWVRQEISAQTPDKIWISYGRRMIHFQILFYFATGLKNAARQFRQAGNMSYPQEVISSIVSAHGFSSLEDSMDSSVSERARLVHILETWLRKIYLWGDGLQATDPRDLLFSLYSMTIWKEEERQKLYPDYSKDCREVYIDMAKYWPKLAIWRNDPDDTTGRDLSLPSWVPDWRRRIRPVHVLRLPPWEGNSELQYWAGNMLQYEGGYEIKPTRYSKSTDHPCFVYMEGFVVDKIDDVGAIMVRGQSLTAGETCRNWVSQMNGLAKRQKSLRELSVGMANLSISTVSTKHATKSEWSRWRVPIMDLGIVDGSLKQAPESYKSAYDFFTAPARHVQDENLEKVVSYYTDIALAACNKKRFFISNNGFCGLGSRGIQSGDLIVVFPGLMVPLILREVKSQGYRIISDSYVQGIMNGETKTDVGAAGFKLEEFAIY